MIMHFFHARNILGSDDACFAFVFVQNRAPQFRDAILDDDIHLRRPGLLADGLQHLVADRRVIAARRLRVARKTDHRVDKIGAADNADEPSVAHHWEPLDAAALHQLDDNLPANHPR